MAEDQDETPQVFRTGQPPVTTCELSFASELTVLYDGGRDDPDFADIRRRFDIDSDAQLADLIEADGRLRLRLNKPVTLQRYLGAVPDLPRRSEPLDAAIDMALRSLARSSHVDEKSIDRLVTAHPQFEPAIREAAALNNALWSTTHMQRHLAASAVKALPCDFGPVMEDGSPRYELRELLGEGAFGQVYLAMDRQLSEEDHPALVSIKVLPGENRSPWTRQQLIDEATKARRINHPYVARVLDRGVSAENQDFIVYEFVEGGDLGRWARRRKGSLRPPDAARLVAKIARGVHAAHMAGLVHCDLKPNNIVLDAESEPKVADFGIAIRAEEQGRPRPEEDGDAEPLGNLAFMSPQQYRTEPGALTIPSDVYALGGILYWLLTGVLPNGSTPEEIRRTHDPQRGRRQPPLLRPHNPEVDRDLEAICRRAMAVEPEDRYSSAAEVAGDLEAWLRHEPLAWTRPSLLRLAGLWTRRKPALAAALALILLLLIVGGIVVARLSAVANQRRLDVAVAEARAEAEMRQRRLAREDLHGFIAGLEKARDEGLPAQVLREIWLSEWLFGPTVLGDGPERFELWRIRTDVVRDLLTKARAAGEENSFHALLWESALGFWLLDDDYREAETVLDDNYRKWQALLDPQDPWLDHLRAMRACATVTRLAHTDHAGGQLIDDRPALEELAAILQRAADMLDADAPGSALHRVILDRQQVLYGPGLLDRPEQRKAAEDRMSELSE